MRTIGQAVRRLRKSKGLTQSEVARLADLRRSSVGEWERGEKEPSWSSLVAFLRGLNASLYDLAREIEPLTAGTETEDSRDGELAAEVSRIKRANPELPDDLVERMAENAKRAREVLREGDELEALADRYRRAALRRRT